MLLATGQFFGAAGGGAPPPLTFSFEDGQAQTSGSFATVNFGTADAARYIAVTIACVRNDVNTRNITAVTIGGVGATIVAQFAAGAAPEQVAIAIAAVPTGTSGAVTVTTTGFDRFSIGVYRMVGLVSPTPFDSGGVSTTTGAGIPLDIDVGGAAISVSSHSSTGAYTVSGTLLDYNASAGTNHRGVHSSKTSVLGESITVDTNINTSAQSMAAASFR